MTAPNLTDAIAPSVHPTSVIDEGVQIGPGTRVWLFCHVQSGARIGERCVLGQNVNIDRGVVVGNGVRIQNNVTIYNGVTLEDDVFVGPSCVFTNVTNPRAAIDRKQQFRQTRVGRGATLGANATIVCGCDLGEYCFVGAGAVVTKDVPAFALVLGVPARLSGWVCECGVRLSLGGDAERRLVGTTANAVPAEAVCIECGRHYQQIADTHLERVGSP